MSAANLPRIFGFLINEILDLSTKNVRAFKLTDVFWLILSYSARLHIIALVAGLTDGEGFARQYSVLSHV